MKASMSRWAYALGSALTLAALIYLGYSIYRYSDQVRAVASARVILSIVVPFGLVYGGVYSIILLAWCHMVRKIDPTAQMSISYQIYARTQIAKYLPGNVFHYIGRQVMMKEKAGVAHLTTLTATAYETMLMAGTAVALAMSGGFFVQLPEQMKRKVLAACVVVLILGSLSIFLFRRSALLHRFVPGITAFTLRDWVRFLTFPVVGYLLFYLFMGQVMYACSTLLLNPTGSWKGSGLFTAIFAAAWLIGFVTPGSPGGMGVREVVLVTGLTPLFGQAASLAIAVVLRGISMTGDGVLYFISIVLARRG